MTKFKVGDRVTLSGTVTEIDTSDWAPYGIRFDGGSRVVWFSDAATPENTQPSGGTLFRDQAAIAALQGMLINTDVSPGGDARAMAKSSFDLAEALDAERKKRDGG